MIVQLKKYAPITSNGRVLSRRNEVQFTKKIMGHLYGLSCSKCRFFDGGCTKMGGENYVRHNMMMEQVAERGWCWAIYPNPMDPFK